VKKYRMCDVGYGDLGAVGKAGLRLQCTDPATLQWMIQETQRLYPKSKTSYWGNKPEGGHRRCFISKLDYSESAWQLMQILCENGWQPFHKEETKLTYKVSFCLLEE